MILARDGETGYWTKFANGASLVNLHEPRECQGRGCGIHGHPSGHALRNAPLNWRTDAQKLERLCPHGIGHDDFDAVQYQLSRTKPEEQGYVGRHSCDGCCYTQKPQEATLTESNRT